MEHRPFGATGLEVSAIGFGCWEIGGGYGDIEETEFARAVGRALDLGINCFDTAEGYGMGASEQALGQGARRPPRRGDHRHQVRHELHGQAEPPRQQPRARASRRSTRACRTSAPTTSTCTSCTGPTVTTPFEETMSALDDVVRDGQGALRRRSRTSSSTRSRRAWTCGASTSCSTAGTCSTGAWSARSCRTARSTASASWRTARSPTACSRGTLHRGPSTSAPTTGASKSEQHGRDHSCSARSSAPRSSRTTSRAVEELKAIAARYDRSLPQLALRWAISHPAVSTRSSGAAPSPRSRTTSARSAGRSSDADLAEIDAIFARHGVDTVPDYWIEEA